MSYKIWLSEYQGLSWSKYCKLQPDEKEMLRLAFEEYKAEVYGDVGTD